MTTTHVGCTATRQGLEREQIASVRRLLAAIPGEDRVLHHGDCVGGDEQIAAIAKGLGYRLHCHPPSNQVLRAFFESDITEPPKPYLTRNKAIVAASSVLIAAPWSGKDRGGTWMTIGHARGRILVHIVYPNGRVDVEPSRGKE